MAAASVDLSSVTDTLFTDFQEEETDDLLDAAALPASLLCGREKEAALLLQTYESVAQSRQCRVALVHGPSGQGKTALVHSFRDAVLCPAAGAGGGAGGLFCGAKYFQNSGFQEPRSAIVAAFSDLCDLVVQSSRDALADDERRRQQIRRDLGPEGRILRNVITNISPFLDVVVPEGRDWDGDVKSEAVMKLVNAAFRNFLRAMASCNQPVVVFLDDIQWMDEGSRKLIEMYMCDSELKNVMFILAYRDEDIDSVERLLTSINLDACVNVPVGALSKEGVADLVAKILQRPQMDASDKEKDINELVELIYQRTTGNPFHVIQFIDTIQLEDLLTFDCDSKSWRFDVQDIKRQVMIATSVADLLLRKIQLLPAGEQETLKVASLLGYDFDESVLFQILQEVRRSQDSDKSVATSLGSFSLKKAHEIGLVERVADVCHFPHDKIQTAFRSMISAAEEMQLERTIGETYLSLENDDSVYLAALHLNQTVHLMKSPEERLRLVRINLEASKFASDRSAFDAAAELLRKSIDILDCDKQRDKWSEHFDLTFEITEKLARVELIVGNLKRCRELTEQALSRATTLHMKLNSLLNAVECQPTTDEFIQTAMGALNTLGVYFPRKVRIHHVIRKFLSVKRSLFGKTDQDILNLPPAHDEVKKTASRILSTLCLQATLTDEEFIALYAALVAFELTLRYGLNSESPTYMMIFAAAESHSGNYKKAMRFARLGKTLLDRGTSKTTECSAVFVWVAMLAHWTEPLVDLQGWLVKGVESGFQSGDVMFTPVTMATLFGMTFELGCNLQDLKGLMQQYYNRLRDLSQDEAILLWVQPSFQAVINLQSEAAEWIDVITLTGEIMNEKSYFKMAANVRNDFVETIPYSFKAVLAYHFGFIDLAVKAYERMANLAPQFYNSASSRGWLFWGSLIFYEQYRRTGARKHFRKARNWQRRVEKIHARGSPNVPYVSLLQAEEKSFSKKLDVNVLVSSYDAAITDMADEKLVHLEALANERVGFVLARRRMTTEANKYFDRALSLYRCGWGATAKYDWLQEMVSFHLVPLEAQSTEPSSPQVVGNILVLDNNRDFQPSR